MAAKIKNGYRVPVASGEVYEVVPVTTYIVYRRRGDGEQGWDMLGQHRTLADAKTEARQRGAIRRDGAWVYEPVPL